ncbi:aminotransferase [Rhizobium tubonense]|uniref:Aspartate aminotransferase family protein n=1 Tax=Rhizobium tubonense TaxID=484088 RepID=A0A2W4CRH4_9HYPH|nr:aminotransferase [Rhizobium tubonense]PZM12955.1 aspartate aminotransferase family protein [Rhizobium tubonense]
MVEVSLSSLEDRDVKAHFHSQTNPKNLAENGPIAIARGDGPYVVDNHGNRFIDAMAGLWCASLGFSNARLAQAASRQYETMGFYHTFFNRTHGPVVELAEKLLDLTEMRDGKVYFATSGSEANETMVKLSWLYHAERGKPSKRKVIARQKSFHGSTIAASSMCGLPHIHRGFGLPLSGFIHTSAPYSYRGKLEGENESEFVARLCQELENLILREGPDTIAAFIAEPIQAGGGIIPPPQGYFEGIQRILLKYDVLALADEIVCGFGRTGSWFGKDTVGYKPDMVALSKGLSAGHFPISAVVVTDEVYRAAYRYNENGGNFSHGFTNSGHPVGAAVALEAIKIYREMDVVQHVRQIGARLRGHLDEIARGSSIIGDVRGEGLMLAVELVEDKAKKTPFAPSMTVGSRLDKIAYANGLVIRCMGDTIGFSPALNIDSSQADEIAEKVGKSIADLERQLL